MKKLKGSPEFIASLIVIGTVSVLFVIIFYANLPMKIKNDAENISRRYMFKIEQDGYLTPENKQELIKNLTDRGCKNISISATNTKVDNGKDVNLRIEYDTPIKEIIISDKIIPEFKDNTTRVIISKSTISKAKS